MHRSIIPGSLITARNAFHPCIMYFTSVLLKRDSIRSILQSVASEGIDFFKRQVHGFFILVTGISVGIALLGISYYPNQILRYDAYFSPLIFAAAGTLPSFLFFSRKELSFRQMLFRKILHFLLLEFIQLVIGYATGLIADFGIAIALSLTVFFVYLFKTIIDWLLDSKIAASINSGLKHLQE